MGQCMAEWLSDRAWERMVSGSINKRRFRDYNNFWQAIY